MTLDDHDNWREHAAAEKAHRDAMEHADWLVERDEEAAIGAMYREGYECGMAERPWEFRRSDDDERAGYDRRLFGHDEADNPMLDRQVVMPRFGEVA